MGITPVGLVDIFSISSGLGLVQQWDMLRLRATYPYLLCESLYASRKLNTDG